MTSSKIPYFQKLLDPRWQKRRLEMLESRDWICEFCGDSNNTLHVHHKQYIKGKEPWEYSDLQLAVFCDPCHERAHKDHDLLLDVISRLPTGSPHCHIDRNVAFLVAGINGDDDLLNGASQIEAAYFNVGARIWRYVDKEFSEIESRVDE